VNLGTGGISLAGLGILPSACETEDFCPVSPRSVTSCRISALAKAGRENESQHRLLGVTPLPAHRGKNLQFTGGEKKVILATSQAASPRYPMPLRLQGPGAKANEPSEKHGEAVCSIPDRP